jgi:hypothetical protein
MEIFHWRKFFPHWGRKSFIGGSSSHTGRENLSLEEVLPHTGRENLSLEEVRLESRKNANKVQNPVGIAGKNFSI